MKLLLENWRKYLNEDTMDMDDIRCRALYTPLFVYTMGILEKNTEQGAKEIISRVKDDIPNIEDLYSKFEKDTQKKEFLKEIFIEYIVETIIRRFKDADMTIDQFVDKTEKDLKSGNWKAPWFEQFKDCLISGPGKHTPMYHMPLGGQAKGMVPEPSAEKTFAMFEGFFKK